jgi:hypothetical protein
MEIPEVNSYPSGSAHAAKKSRVYNLKTCETSSYKKLPIHITGPSRERSVLDKLSFAASFVQVKG